MDVVDMLERIGKDAGLRNASREELEKVFEAEPASLLALFDQDHARLAQAGGAAIVCSAQFPGPGEEEEDEGEGEDEGENAPFREE